MLYSEEKERENRFKLALRMGLPVFALAVITTASLLLKYFTHIPYAFIIVAFAILGIMVYYLFYLIYQGFNERITDPITHTFTREYFMRQMQKDVEKKPYTFILMSVVNIGEINKQYGFANGDRILYDVGMKIVGFLEERKLMRVPIAHFKGGDFIVAIEGTREANQSLMDVMCIKFRQYSSDDIEINVIGSMTDSSRLQSLEKIVEWLYELQNENLKMQNESEDGISLDTIEALVVEAIENRSFSYAYQAVYDKDGIGLYEQVVKLVSQDGKLVHQKRFMPVVSRLGLLRQFDEIQTEAALEKIGSVEEPCKIALAVAASSLRNPLFIEHIMMLVSNNAQVRDRIVFIISERSYYHQIQQFNARLQAFRRAGILIALDRLGGMQTTMRYLHDLDVDIVRFENHLSKAVEDTKTQALIKGLQQAVTSLGYRSWIGMVEDEAQYETVKMLHIDFIQGNYLSPIDIN
jgi:EAL domain-containing protein (putative c-di-GMP-specific phosphodiesterase class I)